MADLISQLRAVMPDLHAISATLGLNRHRVYRITRPLPDFDGYSAETDTVEELLEGGQTPGFRILNTNDYMRGANPDATVEIGPFTPEVTISFLDLEGNIDGTEVFYRVIGENYPDGARFQKVGLRFLTVSAYIQLKRIGDE